jgi:hypothetical protein
MPCERETDVAALPLTRLLIALKRYHAAGMGVTDITSGALGSARSGDSAWAVLI